jgi:hypothetical protein
MRTVGLTAITLTMLYGAVGTGASILGLAHNVHQLLHRETYLIALSIMLVWLGAGPKTPRIRHCPIRAESRQTKDGIDFERPDLHL